MQWEFIIRLILLTIVKQSCEITDIFETFCLNNFQVCCIHYNKQINNFFFIFNSKKDKLKIHYKEKIPGNSSFPCPC
jgi:hypothetical protein